jgi:hypothetical protein
MKVTAQDKQGREFEKEITFEKRDEKIIISFGEPCEYYLSDLMKKYPREFDLCIDACGHNHLDSPVYISAKDMNKILEFAAVKCWMFL